MQLQGKWIVGGGGLGRMGELRVLAVFVSKRKRINTGQANGDVKAGTQELQLY